MSDSETPTKKSWLPRLQLSAAAKAAVLVALSLLVTTLVAWWMYAADSSRVAWSDYMTWERGLTIALLFFATVTSTYFVARLWFEQIPASETAIEKAWRAGEQLLSRHGINLQETPLFIVLGVADRTTMDNIMESSGQKILESGVPKSEAPLRWFLTDQGVYLFIGRSSLLAKLNERIKQRSFKSYKVSNDAHQTGEESPGASGELAPDAGTNPSLSRINELENIVNSELAGPTDSLQIESAEYSWSLSELVTTAEQIQLRKNLAALANRLRSARAPIAAFNGVLTFFDGSSVASSEKNAWVLGNGAANELDQLSRLTGIQAPVQCLVGELQNEPGWQELIRRYGAQHSDELLLGAPVEPTQLLELSDANQLSESSIQAVKDSTLVHFGSSKLLNTPGNEHLVQLKLELRSRWKRSVNRLCQELVRNRISDNENPRAGFLGGLFYSATGSKPAQRAFVQPVLRRLVSQQDLLEWTVAQKNLSWRLRLTLRLVQSSFAIALIALVLQLVY